MWSDLSLLLPDEAYVEFYKMLRGLFVIRKNSLFMYLYYLLRKKKCKIFAVLLLT